MCIYFHRTHFDTMRILSVYKHANITTHAHIHSANSVNIIRFWINMILSNASANSNWHNIHTQAYSLLQLSSADINLWSFMHDHLSVRWLCAMYIYCPNKKLMNHFEMKKLDRQMHISLSLSLSLSLYCSVVSFVALCVCYVYVWQIFVPSIFVFTIETIYLFNACAIHFRIMVR